MRKALLFSVAALFSLMASAGNGLEVAGANIIILPSSQYDGDIEWKAWTWVYEGDNYGDWNTDNPLYNMVMGLYNTEIDELSEIGPYQDVNGKRWYEPGYDTSVKLDENGDTIDYNSIWNYPIVWEEHTAPFSSDQTYKGRPSYQWLTTTGHYGDIYVRRTFKTDMLLSGPVYLACGHDDAPCEYYINGELVFRRTGRETNENGNILNGWNNSEYIKLTDEQKALIKLGGEENVIAFHVHQNWGGYFADCGLYTKIEGGLDMGYDVPWEGKVLFNNVGGYNRPSNGWSKLYEAQEGDVYSFTITNHSDRDSLWYEQVHFKSPIRIQEDNQYYFKTTLKADKPFANVTVKLTDNNFDKKELSFDQFALDEFNTETELYEKEFEVPFTGIDSIFDFKVVFDFAGGEDSTKVYISDMSLLDVTEGNMDEGKELWIGTHYFNYFYMTKPVDKYMIWDDTLKDGEGDFREVKNEEEKENYDHIDVVLQTVNAPEMTGRVETKAWTQADFDDSMWDDQMMPVCGTYDYYGINVQSIWPGGDNTNYWIRRNFELSNINERVEYQLNVCHDDSYETYVNGHLLQIDMEQIEGHNPWTDGKSPIQVHIPSRYLNVGKNVIATYIQQNWGGRFYDCGINVTEINYDDCLQQFNDALAYAQKDTLLTNKMKENIQAIIASAQEFYEENKNDAAELRSYARDTIRAKVNKIFGYSSNVKMLKVTYEICSNEKDNGWWGTALADAAAALDTCATSNQINTYLAKLRDARKANAMERHTEKFVGCQPEAITDMDLLGMTEDYDFNPLPRYLLYNVGTKCFLGGGEAWGAHLAIEYASNPMMIIQAYEKVYDEELDETYFDTEQPIEGVYYIETFRPNGAQGVMDFMGWNGFIDVGMGNNLWEFIPVEGKTNVYNIAQYNQFSASNGKTYNGTEYPQGTRSYLGLRCGDNGYAPSYYIVDTDNRSPELENNQWMFISTQEYMNLIAAADIDNPVDLSFLITNPNFDERADMTAWTPVSMAGNVLRNGSERVGTEANHIDYPYYVYEAYNSLEYTLSQDLMPMEGEELLPAGTYVLEVQGYYRDGLEQAHVNKYLNNDPLVPRAFLFAGSDYETFYATEPLAFITDDANKVPGFGWVSNPGNMAMPGTGNGCLIAGREYFPCGLYKNQLAFELPEDYAGYLCIGVSKPADENVNDNYGDWVVVDNWRLKYYGKNVDPDAIRGIESDEINSNDTAAKAAKGIYNMLGQRMSKTQKGINIVNGKKIIKK